MPTRRTIRKPTRWTPEEWRQIETAARARGVPPLRYVREAALAAKLEPRAGSGSRQLVQELKRVLNNLNQLRRVAEQEAAEAALMGLEATIQISEDAVRAAAVHRGSTDALVEAVIEAGRYLNEVTYSAHKIKELPPEADLSAALAMIITAALQVIG